MDRLDGWKEIAAHLRLSVRHCQRLAKEAGLPVHRRGGTRAVCASVEELDRWIHQENESEQASTVEPEVARHLRLVSSQAAPAQQEPSFPDVAARPDRVETVPPPARSPWLSRVLPLVLTGAAALAAAAAILVGVQWWRTWSVDAEVISGSWHRVPGGHFGRAATAGRLDTGRWVGPGSSVSVELEPRVSRWAGGLEIHQDRLHRTQVAVTPVDRLVEVLRMPSGELTVLSLGSIIDREGRLDLELAVGDDRLELRIGAGSWLIPLEAHDVARGRLLLAVGREGNEYLPSVPGACLFRDLGVRNPAPEGRFWLAHPLPPEQRVSGRYTLTLDNVDDQIDLLLDGQRLVTAAYREHVEGFDLTPFLSPGKHTLTALVFNRKWTTTYGVRLTVDGETVWSERCGHVNVHGGECPDLGSRTGLVRRLEHTLLVR